MIISTFKVQTYRSVPNFHVQVQYRSYAKKGQNKNVIRASVIDGQLSVEEIKKQVVENEAKYIVGTYARPSDLVITQGDGCRVFDIDGTSYLDFSAGIAVNCLGHSDPLWLKSLVEQATILTHTSNLFHTVPQVEFAQRLVESCFADKVFFCNTGTEANEAAIKFARKWAKVKAGVDPYDGNVSAPYELVSFTNCFHGRTLGALALTYKDQYKTPFLPGLPGTIEVPFLDVEAAKNVIQKGRTAAVFVEPVQGEGGVNSITTEYLRTLRKLCDEAGALLVFDEVQCGLGRTGKLWAHQHFDVTPDIMTAAKPLAGGLPIGTVMVSEDVACVMKPGDHGSTYAGNPLVCHVASAVFDVVSDDEFLGDVARKGELLKQQLQENLKDNPHVKEVRGMGLIVGIELDMAAGDLVTECRKNKLIVITAGAGNIIRLVPPLVVSDDEIQEAVSILSNVLNNF
eukprot:TRINITY_DN18519_c0_g4_i2.p1 TRINITY_DN18519_c0_g4~~TRINITY_DN18519_c0_g4_i2.p1  ORF type:complete len:456 (-),score=56.59 TRINITY_DN18519_c0_g4_i2:307-1674(-)